MRGRRPHRAHRPQLGDPAAIAAADIDALYDRYQNVYGQRPDTAHAPARRPHEPAERAARSGSSPAARTSTARRPCARSPSSPADRRALDAAAAIAGRRGLEAGLTDSDAIRRVVLEANADDDCVGVITWMHTFSPAKMWIAGLDALRKPLLHLHTQANVDAALVDHRHGLHEPQPGRPRRPRVRLHPDPAGRGRKTVAGHVTDPAVPRRIGALGPRRARRARAADPAAGPVRRQHARRRRHRGRQGRGRSCGSASRSTPTASTTWSTRVDAVDGGASTTSSRSTSDLYDVAAGAARRRRAARLAALRAPRSRSGLREFLDERAASARSPPTSRTSAACASFPGLAVQRLMADGYGFGGEGDWKTAVAAPRRSR